MGASTAVLTQGTKLYRKDPVSLVYTAVPNIVSMAGPDSTKGEKDASDLDSVAKEYVLTLPDFGRLSVELQYNATIAIHAAIFADFVDQTSPTRDWRMDFVNGKKWSFQAKVFGFPLSVAADDITKVTMNLRLTGTVTET